ncbi:carbohydrate ABC transporter permease [Catellatospora citrea]|uniref:Sugar ABC transporter permease n=1 Tax=Catellatospora citrea TaxID=53366 RepID=A0A8J3K732_9ACTN|nr:carbohydrate ABC transporter permease [Catellatospora citrea]RKE10207.1 cellobiose ABC transporter membrane protein [Catellatospora citrea]GIF97881.1 sugar ABC transporter permease [Catellatospora citrea]
MTATAVRTGTTPTPAPKRRRRKGGGAAERLWQASPLTYITLLAAVGLSIFPLYYMFVIATRTNDAIGQTPPPVTPGGEIGGNVDRLLSNDSAAFMTGLVNSAIVATVVTVFVVFFSSLAGFAFAKLQFKGRNGMMLAILITMMVPTQLGIVPLYQMMYEWDLHNKLPSIILPFLVSGFGVFMMRQYASQAVPDELIEAARMDGCSTFRTYWNVVLPGLRPAIAVLGLFTFMEQWNSFLWPQIALGDPTNPTVQLSLQRLSQGYYNDYSQVFAGTLLSVVPLLVIFIIFGRQIIGGIMEGAVKA